MLIICEGRQNHTPMAQPSLRVQAELRAAAAERRQRGNAPVAPAATSLPTRSGQAFPPSVNPPPPAHRCPLTFLYSIKRR